MLNDKEFIVRERESIPLFPSLPLSDIMAIRNLERKDAAAAWDLLLNKTGCSTAHAKLFFLNCETIIRHRKERGIK